MGDRTSLESGRHVVALAVAGIAVLATLAGWSPTPLVALVIVGLAAAIGMPHGALDVAVGPRALSARRFFVGYGLLAALTVLVWFAAPLVSLVVFFAMSWFHFGSGDAEHRPELGRFRFAHGAATSGAVLGMPLLFHAGTVTPVFDDLLLGDVAVTASQIALCGLGLTACAGIAALLTLRQAFRLDEPDAVIEIVAIFALASVVHPLVSFAIYFALWHSPRHLMALDVGRSDVVPTLAATVATFVAAGVVWSIGAPSVATTTQVVFIGLAALTTPHLVVTESVRRRRLDSARAARRPLGFSQLALTSPLTQGTS